VWSTPQGDVTVYAIRKPLGLIYKRETPFTIEQEKESHAKDIGIRKGWVLKEINNRNVAGLQFPEVDKMLKAEVDQLPGAIPLKWDTGRGEIATVYAYKRPLRLVFDKDRLPITITREVDGHGKDIGVKVGWKLVNVNYRDVSQVKSYAEAEDVMRAEVAKLPPDP
jgi:hypothetical protein